MPLWPINKITTPTVFVGDTAFASTAAQHTEKVDQNQKRNPERAREAEIHR